MRVKYLPQDNEARVNNGICFYNGIPYTIGLLSATEGLLQPIYRKKDVEALRINLTDERLDISAPRLGYINANGGTIYIKRRPERRYKQTLQANGCWGYWPYLGQAGSDSVNGAIHSAAGEKMFLNDYPNLTKAIGTLLQLSPGQSIAISRDVAIGVAPNKTEKEYGVFFKNDLVGRLTLLPEPTVKLIESDFKWVSERELSKFAWKLE
jgi:hypothetical protein